ncbi:hypothetical protein BJV78DRAFT_205623 [Lactifluus subvellereus]|nr:hypothetical protein BJV78DRAFT_205623 [Lactifluus subvellereus]
MSVLILYAVSPARRQSGKHSVADHSSVSKLPSQTTGVRQSWRMLSSGARSLLCLRATDHMHKEQWSSDDHRDVLPYARPASDISFTSSPSGEALLLRTSTAPRRTQKLYTGNHPVRTKSEHRLPARATAAPAAAAPAATSGNIKDAPRKAPVMGPTFRVGNGGGGPEVDRPIRIRARAQALDKAKWDRERSSGSGEGADARRAWEAMKRRILYIEEHGSLPDDYEDEDAMRDGAERASRERRARRRKGWAEEAIRGKAQEDARAAKKRRRNGGCWTCENGILMRLQARRSESSSRL